MEARAREAEKYARAIADALQSMSVSYEAERTAWTTQAAATVRHVAALERRAADAERYSTSLREALDAMRASCEAERVAWTEERRETMKRLDAVERRFTEAEVFANSLAAEMAASRERIASLDGQVSAFRRHWPYKLLPYPKGGSFRSGA
jgi:predicted  nucleic acid-binding Zn-ribbon protein